MSLVVDKYKEHVACSECHKREDCPSRTAKVDYADLKQLQEIVNGQNPIEPEAVNEILNKYL